MKNFTALARRVALTAALATPMIAAEKNSPAPKEFFVYFGTYTGPKSKGIYRSRLDVVTGKLSPAEVAAECSSPAFLAVHPTGKFLYAIDESSDPATKPGRGLAAYSLDQKIGALALLNQQTAGGSGPCHLAVDHAGQSVLVANYGGGSVAAVPLQPDGRLGALGTFIQHTGSSVNATRQKGPHAHVIVVAPDNRFALTADLGLDKILVYRLDAAKGTLAANTPAFATVPPGSGPRHLAFHPGGKFVYVINEMLCTMSVFRYEAARGELTELQSISTLPPGEAVQPGTSTAEVVVHPSGKFLIGSNRGHNTIAVFAIDQKTGRLTHIENQPTLGKTPRHFAVDPTGTWLLAENQDSDNVVVFRIDQKSGRLAPTGQSLAVPSPVCAVFVAAR